MAFLKQLPASSFIVFGTGLAGFSYVLYCLKKSSEQAQALIMQQRIEIQRLKQVFQDVQRELDEVKGALLNLKKINEKCMQPSSAYYSVHVSSDEEEDEWLDPISGPVTEAGTAHEVAEEATAHPYAAIDALLEGSDSDKEEALKQIQSLQMEHEDQDEFLWRKAKATFFLANICAARKDSARHKQLVYEAKEVAYSCIERNPQSADGHKWCAITIGSLGEFEGTKQKLLNGIKYKEHIDRALELKPADPSLHYLSGRFAHGIAALSWIERKAATALFGALPDVTMDDALDSFLEAERLKPSVWKENMLFVAKCYLHKRNVPEALSWLRKAQQLPVKTADEQPSHAEIERLLEQHG